MHRQYAALSGIAISLIALNHAIHFGLDLNPAGGSVRHWLVFLQALGAFAVPAFLFISGAFLSYSAAQLSWRFVKSNVGRIAWPYLVWSTIFYAVVLFTNEERQSAAGYVKSLVVGYPYHFVPLLLFWYVAAPLVVKVGRSSPVLLLSGIGSYQAALLAIRYPEIFGNWQLLEAASGVLKLPVLFTSMSDWAIYFPLGLVLSLHGKEFKPHLLRIRSAILVTVAMLFALGLMNAYGLVSAAWARLVVPIPLMFVLPTIDRDSIPGAKRLESIGKQSYGIYLVHFVVLNIVAALWLDTTSSLRYGVYPVFIALALGVPLLMMDALQRVPRVRKIYRYVFGFAPPPAERRRPIRGDVTVAAVGR
jgi:surface polysaccharide O-acyltransferase-like enzyme